MTWFGQLIEAHSQMMKCLAGLCDPLPEHDKIRTHRGGGCGGGRFIVGPRVKPVPEEEKRQ